MKYITYVLSFRNRSNYNWQGWVNIYDIKHLKRIEKMLSKLSRFVLLCQINVTNAHVPTSYNYTNVPTLANWAVNGK